MALTLPQIKSLGFVPSKRGGGLSKYRKYDTLVYKLNKTDFLYIGYNQYSKEINNKSIWKSFKHPDTHDRITYKVWNIGETTFSELKDYLDRCDIREAAMLDYSVEVPPMKDNEDGVSIVDSLENLSDTFNISEENIPNG